MTRFLFSFSSGTTHTIDMTFEISAINQFCQNVLLKHWDRTRIKSQFFLEILYHLLWKHHIADSHRRRNCMRKGIQINYCPLVRKSKYRIFIFFRYSQLRIIIIFYNISSSAFCPTQIFVTLRYTCGNTAWKTVKWCYMKCL